MSTVADARASTHPQPVPRTSEQIVADLLPLAAQLVGCVHDHGPDARDQVLANVPDDAWPQLAVVLAAMVDPDRTVSESLAWLDRPRSLEGTEFDLEPEPWNVRRVPCPMCGELVMNRHMSRHRRRQHPDTFTDAQQVA